MLDRWCAYVYQLDANASIENIFLIGGWSDENHLTSRDQIEHNDKFFPKSFDTFVTKIVLNPIGFNLPVKTSNGKNIVTMIIFLIALLSMKDQQSPNSLFVNMPVGKDIWFRIETFPYYRQSTSMIHHWNIPADTYLLMPLVRHIMLISHIRLHWMFII